MTHPTTQPTSNTTPIRCAIYTRQSSEEALAQDCHSPDAQRLAAEKYIAKQQRDGWICLPTRYNDNAPSGNPFERPALKRLLADICAGLIDCVVVWNIDRFARSLHDFFTIASLLESRQVNLVSVKQSFSTFNLRSKYMLRAVLIAAEYERDLIDERQSKSECLNLDKKA